MTASIPATSSAPLHTVVDAQGVVTVDLECKRCGYNLRGLHYEHQCPECATPVGRTLSGDLLRFSDPSWLAGVQSGLHLIVVGTLLAVLFGCIGGGADAALKVAGSPAMMSLGNVIKVGLPLLASIVVYIGVWRMSERDPSGFGDDREFSARKIVRIALMVGIIGVGINAVLETVALPSMLRVLLMVAAALIGLVAIVGEFAKYTYYERLANRIPNRPLATGARLLKWTNVVALAVVAIAGGTIACVLLFSGFNLTTTGGGRITLAGPGTLPTVRTSGTTVQVTSAPAASAPATSAPAVAGPAAPGGAGGGMGPVILMLGLVAGLAGTVLLASGLFALLLVWRLARQLEMQVALARAAWAVPMPTRAAPA